jgi:O-antigen ligase
VLNLFLLYFYVAKIINSRSDVLFIVRVLLIGLIIESALMLAQAGGVVGSFNVFGIRASAEFVGTNRISGTLGSPNPAAAYLAMSMTFAAGVMLSDVGRTDKVLARLALVMAVVPFIYTLSRGGWLSFLLGVTILLGLGGRKVAWRAVGVALVVLVLLVSPFAGRIQQRLSSEEGKTAVEDRIPLNKVAFAMIEDHPLLGVGVNNYPLAMEPYLAHYLLSDFIYPVHNVYLLFFAETGIGGLIAFVWILFAIVREGAKCWRTGDRLLSPLALGCAGATVGFAVQMLFDPLRNCPAADLLWLFGGVVATMSRLSGSFSSTWETPTVEPLF